MLFLILNRVELDPYIYKNEPMFPVIHYPYIGNEYDNYSELYKEIILECKNLLNQYYLQIVFGQSSQPLFDQLSPIYKKRF